MSIFCLDREFADSEGTPYAGVPRTPEVYDNCPRENGDSDFEIFLVLSSNKQTGYCTCNTYYCHNGENQGGIIIKILNYTADQWTDEPGE